MTARTIDLSGLYVVAAVTATDLVLDHPENINPSWNYANLAGDGTTGYAQNISMIRPPVYRTSDLSGTGYVVSSVSAREIHLNDPATVATDWGNLGGVVGFATKLLSANLSTTNNANWIGPFIVEGADTTLLVANFVAQGGLFKDDGKKQTAFPITVQLEATPVDLNDNPVGAPQAFQTTIEGNTKDRDLRAATLVCELAHAGRQSVRARRLTNADLNFKGTVVDDVKWQDLYGVAAAPVPDFGNVTTVHTRTYATEGALAVKQRKLNMLATRLVPIRTGGTSFSAPAATRSAADIFAAICLDPYIGRRQLAELDLDAIYGAVAASVGYFGRPEAGEFCYTFDDDKVSFEETGAIVASAVFCTAYRQGSLIRLSLEKATEDSVLLFNHRNKVPGTETRTIRFGNLDDNDGVEIEWVDPADESAATFYVPSNRSALNPKNIKAVGVRNRLQAYWMAWRSWNKIRYQNTASEFQALQEAAIVVRNDRILVADNTRSDTQDGEILSVNGLELETSQPVVFSGGAAYTIFLQLPDGTVDSLAVAAGSSDHRVLIARAPRVALVVGQDQYANPGYQIVRNDSAREDAFLVTQREAADGYTFNMQAINYSPLYYANDQLALWLDFQGNYLDAGPYARDAIYGGGGIVNDPTRGDVHQGNGQLLGLPSFVSPASYTKAFWARRDGLNGTACILSSVGASEYLALGPWSVVRIGHGSGDVLAAEWPGAAGEWHHVAATYDAATSTAAIYIDGELKAAAGSIGRGPQGALDAIGFDGAFGLGGALDDARLISRALYPSEVRALYRMTRL